jgi:DNA-binding transcriptional ArsR family regulator
VDEVFAALGDPTRRRVLEVLGEGPRRPGELAAELGITRPVVSRHLRILLEAELIVDLRLPEDARARVFRLQPNQLARTQAWLDQLQAGWLEQLEAFARHVDGSSEEDG